MYLLFDKQTKLLSAYSQNDLSDQVGDLFTLHEQEIEIDETDMQGYKLSGGKITYAETVEHKAMIADRKAIPSRAELFEQINQLQARLDQLEK